MDNLHTRLLAKDDGRLEAAVGLVLLIGAVIVAAVSEEWPAWPLLVAGGLLLWAILLAPSSGIRSTGVVLCVASGHFVGDVEASAFIALLAFVVLEVQVLAGRWIASAVTGGIIVMWFLFGQPLAAWTVSLGAEVLIALMGVFLAATVGLIRRMLRMERRERLVAVELESMKTRVELARSLHDSVADSLTRIVLLSGMPAGDLEQRRPAIHAQAREAIASLRGIIGHLRGEDAELGNGASTSTLCLEAEINRALAEMSAVGLSPTMEISSLSGVRVSEPVGRAVREVATNVLKHGDDPVRIVGELTNGTVRLLVVNRVLAHSRDRIGGTGMGLLAVDETLSEAGGRMEVAQSRELMQVVLEFPDNSGIQ